jgi:hypothetical protein
MIAFDVHVLPFTDRWLALSSQNANAPDLPAALSSRLERVKKQGVPVPHQSWFRTILKPLAPDLRSSSMIS